MRTQAHRIVDTDATAALIHMRDVLEDVIAREPR
jgi:hypothetical protein